MMEIIYKQTLEYIRKSAVRIIAQIIHTVAPYFSWPAIARPFVFVVVYYGK